MCETAVHVKRTFAAGCDDSIFLKMAINVLPKPTCLMFLFLGSCERLTGSVHITGQLLL